MCKKGSSLNSSFKSFVYHDFNIIILVEWGHDVEPPPGHTELPTCSVCLERMDESVDGVLTILCNHTFHAGCLVKWGDSTCPICRYVQTPEYTESSLYGVWRDWNVMDMFDLWSCRMWKISRWTCSKSLSYNDINWWKARCYKFTW